MLQPVHGGQMAVLIGIDLPVKEVKEPLCRSSRRAVMYSMILPS